MFHVKRICRLKIEMGVADWGDEEKLPTKAVEKAGEADR